MAAEFCIQNKYQLVGIGVGRIVNSNDGNDHYKFPGDKSSNGKPGEEFKDRIIVST